MGFNALLDNTTGAQNTAIGTESLANCTTANDNTSIGSHAMRDSNTAANNVAIGRSALRNCTTGQNNTMVGFKTGFHTTNSTDGDSNVLYGAYTHTSGSSVNTAHGFGYDLSCASNYTTLGAAGDDIRAAHGNTTWATVSDERYKKDIVDSTAGLSFINALKPRTFKYKNLGELPSTFNAYEADSTDVFKNSNTNHGFIAQEVKAAIDADSSIKDGFKMWDDRPDGSQEVGEAALIPVLVKAIQELSAEIEILKNA